MHSSQNFEILLSLALEGEASSEQITELKQLLRDDPKLQELARQQTSLHGQIGVALEDELTHERISNNIISAIKQSDEDQFVDEVKQKISQEQQKQRRVNFPAFAAIAALIILSITGIVFFNQPSQPSTVNSLTMATVSRTEGVQWTEKSNFLNTGSSIASGGSVQINSGLLELELAGRGRFIVEGPAHIDFPEHDKAVLHHGRVVMRATKMGQGYQIETPQGNIIDRGTEFGVSVEPDGNVETHVIDGSIEAIPKHGAAVTLLRDDALAMSSTGGKTITADVGKFYTQLPPEHSSKSQFIHWGFNENKGKLAAASGDIVSPKDYQTSMIFHAMDQGSNPKWVKGIKGSAVKFDGLGSYAESGYPGIEGGKPRTVTFWLKTPKKFNPKQGFGIVSWGRLKQPGEAWQISVNPLAKDGAIGRLRLGLRGGQIIGTTDLRDNKWHHIAIVLYGGSQPNVGTHVLLYIDGKKEAVSRATLQEVRTEIEKANHGVWIGRNISYEQSSPEHPHGGFFRGEMDELYIHNTALSHEEIKNMIQKDRE